MRLFTNRVKAKVVGASLALMMLLGVPASVLPSQLEGTGIVNAAQVGDPEVTILPDPVKTGGGSGGGSSIDLDFDPGITTIYENQIISENDIVLVGFNKNVTTVNNMNPLPYEAININDGKVYVEKVDNAINPVFGAKVSTSLLATKNGSVNPPTKYNQDSYRNFIYIDTTGLITGDYKLVVEYGVISANATEDGSGDFIQDSKSVILDDPNDIDNRYIEIPFRIERTDD